MPEINTSLPPDAGRIAGMVRQFHRAVERQRERDAETLASVIRALRNPRAAEEFTEAVSSLVKEAKREMQRP